MVALKSDVAGPNATPLESLLAERISLCWLSLQYYDILHTHNAKTNSLEWCSFSQKRLERAHNRYLKAIKTLAQIRRLNVPALQANIGEQQVVAAGQEPATLPSGAEP
ncbi:MAG: hypothetical protein LC772_03980 [Chloroflexi bacterium]|nr:hypothetical protein [Chloroflexota bacterium]